MLTRREAVEDRIIVGLRQQCPHRTLKPHGATRSGLAGCTSPNYL